MSTVQDTPAAMPAATTTTEPAATTTPAVVAPEAPVESKADGEAPVASPETSAEQTAAAVDEVKNEPTEKAVEPIAEGQLAYKGPGLVKSLIPSKKEFWLTDDAVVPQNLDLYLRGEKPEVAHPVVAWASQTGKGLLFFNKKGDTQKTHPADVLALYEATDLKKEYPNQFSFKLHGHAHTFKAEDEAKRDGWYFSIEKAIELGKASKEEVRNSEGYKAEMEKLNKPNTLVAGAATRSLSKPKKSVEVPAEQRINSSDGELDDKKKDQKSRSTSRGILNRFKGYKEEAEAKSAEKKEEKKEEKEETKTEGENTAPVADTTESAPIAAAMASEGSPAAAEAQASEEKAAETPVADEKVRPSKRGSIFGRVSSTWSKIQSPVREKDQKEVELKPESANDAAVSENPPVLPETTASTEVADTAVPAVEEPKAEEATEAKKDEPAASPSKEKSNFLSGIGGFIKRNRSVSPSTHMKEPAKKEETPAVEEPVVADPAAAEAKAEEPATEAGAAAETSTETPAEKVEEPKTENTTPNKRQSVLGSLGRRASKALNRIQAPKKDSSAPAATEAKKEETAETKPAEETPEDNGESKKAEPEAQQSIGDVVPDAVNVGQPQHQSTPAVSATA